MTPALAFHTLSNGQIAVVCADGYCTFDTPAEARAWADQLCAVCALLSFLMEVTK